MANYIPKIEYGVGPTTIQFDYPPQGDNLDETFSGNAVTNRSNAGVEQTQWNYNEHTISPKFTFVSQSIHDALETFMLDWAFKGYEFKYYESSDVASYWTMTMTKKDFKAKKIVCDGGTGFIWDIEFEMRRTL